MAEIKFEVNHLEFLGEKETIGEAKEFFRAHGSEYQHIAENSGVKYIITEAIESGKTIVRLDSMILNYCTRLLPECKEEKYQRVDSHPEIFKHLHPSYYKSYCEKQEQFSRALTAFDNELEKKGISLSSSDDNYWKMFNDSPEYKAIIRTEGIMSVHGGFVSYDCEKQILELKGRSGNYGKPSDKHLIGLAPIILEEANKLAPVKMVKLDNGKSFVGRALKTQMLEEMIINFNNEYIEVENLR